MHERHNLHRHSYRVDPKTDKDMSDISTQHRRWSPEYDTRDPAGYLAASTRFANATYFLVAGLLLAGLIYTLLNPVAIVSFQRDIWHHLAVYRELLASPFFAENPHIASDDPSRSYSPWTVGMALLGRAFGFDASQTLAMAGILSVMTLVAGIFLFARRYWGSPWAPATLLLTLFATWMTPVNHTGYHTLTTFVFSVAYPFSIVLALGFVSWWLVLKALTARWLNPLILLGLVGLSFVMFVTHQLQGLFAIGAGMGFALFAAYSNALRRACVLACLALGLVLTQYWWYFDPIAYVFDPEVRRGHSDLRYLSYSLQDLGKMQVTLGLAMVGVLGLRAVGGRRIRWELALPLAVLIAGFVLLLARDNWVATRIMPFIVLFLQLALVSYLFQPLQRNRAPIVSDVFRGLLVAGLSLLLVVNIQQAWQQYMRAHDFLNTGHMQQRPLTWSADILASMAFAETLVPAGATAIADRQTAFPMEASALKVVSIPRLFAEVPDMIERQQATRDFFATATTLRERCAILQRYDVALIVYHGYWLDDAVEADLARLGQAQELGDLVFIAADAQPGFSSCEAS